MKGENFTRFGLLLFGIGLIIYIAWTSIYNKEYDVIIDGKISQQTSTSKALHRAGTILIVIGYMFCIAGFSIASDILNFSLKMHKSNLIKT